MKIRILVTTLALSLGILSAPVASAHTVLISSSPAAGSTIAQLPESITLTFANPLLTLGQEKVNTVTVVDPMGMTITSGDNMVHGAVLSNVLSPAMVMGGVYKVNFRVAAQDGHVLTGNFIFTVGRANASKTIAVPESGIVQITATATGKGVLDGVGSPTDTATGEFSINFDTLTFCYAIQTKITGITALHVHAASQKNLTISDEIFLPLDLKSVNAHSPVCQKEDGETLAVLATNTNNYIFMIHSKKFPDGDVAGQFKLKTSKGLVVHSATLTASTAGGDSALSVSLVNNTSETILISGFSSMVASSSMLFYDANMCQGNTAAKALSSISMAPGQTQNLGYKFQGAMLGSLKSALEVGQKVAVTLMWSDSSKTTHSLHVEATVVSPPRGLNFRMSGMRSPAQAAAITAPPASVGTTTQSAIPSNVLNAKFIDEMGMDHTLAALKSKTVLIVPLLTLCGDTCPFTSGNMLQIQEKLAAEKASNVVVVGISVDPYRDTQARTSAYLKLVGASYDIWTAAGQTTKPFLTKAELASKNPVGQGGLNPNLTALEKYFGWTVQVVPQSSPPATDWLAPFAPLTYDINHSDGFWIIDPQQNVRFVSGTQPAFTGTLSKVLASFMGYKSNIYSKAVYKGGWTPAEVLQALSFVDQKKY